MRSPQTQQLDPTARAAAALDALGVAVVTHPSNDHLRDRLASHDLASAALTRTLVRTVVRLQTARLLESDGRSGVSADRGDTTLRTLWFDVPRALLDLWPDPPPGTEHEEHTDIHISCEDAANIAAVLNTDDCDAHTLGSVYESLLAFEGDFDVERGRCVLHASGDERRTRGAFYTPEPLVQHLLDNALEPVIDERLGRATSTDERARALFDIRVCDPACGSGRFLVPAARRLAHHLARMQAGVCAQREAMHAVLTRCVFGVDIDPVAATLCRLALWLESPDPALAAILVSRIRVGNALLGATPGVLREGIPDDALRSVQDEEASALAALRRRNKRERANRVQSTPALDAAHARVVADAWCAAFTVRLRNDGIIEAITDGMLQSIERDPESIDPALYDAVTTAAREHRFFHWHLEFPSVGAGLDGGFDVMIGNPPFLNQLASKTASPRAHAGIIRARSSGVVGGYADAAAAFLLLSVQLLRARGRASLVLPRSLLASKDAGPVCKAVLEHASLASMWVADEHVFDSASIYTCAPTLERDGPRVRALERFLSATFDPLPPIEVDTDELRHETTWAPLVAAASGIPEFECPSPMTLGDVAHATADFRDQFYGLDGFLIEHDDIAPRARAIDQTFPPIVTSGLIDLAECRWGKAHTRILKHSWRAPRIDRVRMDANGTLGEWITRRLVSKVILATQTRVLEVFVDESGRFVPGIPLITIVPREPSDLWRIGACVASPVASAIAMRRYSGVALSIDAIKLSAKQTLELPIPSDQRTWDEAANAFRKLQNSARSACRDRHLIAFARSSTAAYALDRAAASDVIEWWLARARGS
ncbi:MAG: N-6 DNA methylase [Planctomycetota bacterium]